MKKYNKEKAIISLTSWKNRIQYVHKTIENLLEKCKGFHIVLCLSSDEFPLMESELPDNLMKLYDKIEILWVKKNYKAFKKVIFTMMKYPDIPIVSADDDCLYTNDYAGALYGRWKRYSQYVMRYTFRRTKVVQGPCTIYPPNRRYHIAEAVYRRLNDEIIAESKDDDMMNKVLESKGIKVVCATIKSAYPFVFHDCIDPITKDQEKMKCYKSCF